MRIINCARGGLIDEAALKAGLDSGHIAGAALDVFVEEPAKASPLFGTPNFVSHAASGRVDHRGAGQRRDPGRRADGRLSWSSGGVTNALNMPSPVGGGSAQAEALHGAGREARRAGRPARAPARSTGISIEAEGAAAELNQKPITSAVLAGFLRTQTDTVNMVNAPFLAQGARHRGARGPHRARGRLPHAAARLGQDRRRRALGRRHAVRQRRAAPGRAVRDQGRGRSRRARCSTSSTRTRRASSAGSARCWARRASTSAPSTSAAAQAGGEAVLLLSVDEPVTARPARQGQGAAGRADRDGADVLTGERDTLHNRAKVWLARATGLDHATLHVHVGMVDLGRGRRDRGRRRRGSGRWRSRSRPSWSTRCLDRMRIGLVADRRHDRRTSSTRCCGRSCCSRSREPASSESEPNRAQTTS